MREEIGNKTVPLREIHVKAASSQQVEIHITDYQGPDSRGLIAASDFWVVDPARARDVIHDASRHGNVRIKGNRNLIL